ncbi:DUF6624 domain-containing protein [Polluticoccus soli]|uniref:DUF6624 domain-containing protein n=1 Tax=Polluticoccus soli TaxID=3034150 RepID=UPI0023E32853|nr:DUF6624 domain-containing protein [Flavipsychrobacter sp. JY13-12]
MKRLLSLLTLTLVPQLAAFAQNATYDSLVHEGEVFYDAKKYKASGEAYAAAFKANNNMGFTPDRYNAACSWSQAGNADSAFSQLLRIAKRGNYSNLNHLLVDADLTQLHSDKRWDEVVTLVKQNKEKAEANLNKPLVAMLDTIMQDDQKYRMQIDDMEKKYGGDSKEMKELWRAIERLDSINLVKVIGILDKYGWVGYDVVGGQGAQALFLVVQHADIATQQKYLPLMREAVKNKKASASALALLEDRVALRTGKKQLYGSQIGRFADGRYYVQPLEDVDNVDKRRAEVGLSPLADYVRNWQMQWSAADYKKQLPEIEAFEKKQSDK